MGSLLGLFTGSFKTYLIAAIVAAILVVVGVFSWKHKSALESLKQAQEQNIQLEKEKTALSQINKQNQTFITNMQADLAKKEQVVNDFRIQKARDDKKLSDLSKVLISYDKKDDGPIAKVLKDAVEGVLQYREGVQK
jgi:flagellar basal body-associated protein FliL